MSLQDVAVLGAVVAPTLISIGMAVGQLVWTPPEPSKVTGYWLVVKGDGTWKAFGPYTGYSKPYQDYTVGAMMKKTADNYGEDILMYITQAMYDSLPTTFQA